MNRFSVWVVIAAVLAPSVAFAGPGEDAVKAYRDYVAAIRAGSVDEAIKLVEPVPDAVRPLLVAYVEGAIAVEAVRTEMVRRMGPEPEDEEEGWNMGQLPDWRLKDLKGVVVDADTVTLRATDPLEAQQENPPDDPTFEVGTVVRRDGRWVLSLSMVMGDEIADELKDMDAAQRAEMIADGDRVTRAARQVLERLKNGEFQEPVDVQSAMIREFTTQPPGPAD